MSIRSSEIWEYDYSNSSSSGRFKQVFIQNAIYLTDNTVFCIDNNISDRTTVAPVLFSGTDLKDLLSAGQNVIWLIDAMKTSCYSEYPIFISGSGSIDPQYKKSLVQTYGFICLAPSLLSSLSVTTVQLLGTLSGGRIVGADIVGTSESSINLTNGSLTLDDGVIKSGTSSLSSLDITSSLKAKRLEVSGTTKFGSGVSIGTKISINDLGTTVFNLTSSGPMISQGDLTVLGNTTLEKVVVNNLLTAINGLAVSGVSVVNDGLTVSGGLISNSNLKVLGETNISTLKTSGLIMASGGLSVSSLSSSQSSAVNITGGATLDGVKIVTGIIDITGSGGIKCSDTVTITPTLLGYLSGTRSKLQEQIDQKANLASPTFTGTVSGITKEMVGLATVDNTSDVSKPVSTATQAALLLKANLDSPVFTGTVSGITKVMVNLANVDNTSDLNKPVSTNTQAALDLKADLASPTFTGTVSGITKEMVDLANVDNTSDLNKPVSTNTQVALDLKANLASPTFTGTVSGITKEMVGLDTVDNTSDVSKPVSTATQAALDLKASKTELEAMFLNLIPNSSYKTLSNESTSITGTGYYFINSSDTTFIVQLLPVAPGSIVQFYNIGTSLGYTLQFDLSENSISISANEQVVCVSTIVIDSTTPTFTIFVNGILHS